VHILPASDTRAEFAITAVDQGTPASELGRLLYGAWTRPLSVRSIEEILRRLQQSGAVHDVEGALGILEQWIEVHPPEDVTSELRSLGVSLVQAANSMSDRSSAMIGLYRDRVINNLGLSFEERLPPVVDLLSQLDSFPDAYDLAPVDALAKENPSETLSAILNLVLGDGERSFDHL
jgi:hypothetical protein